MKKKTILVTGGAGFIGSLVTKRLAKEGHHPIVFDNLSTGRREAVRYGTFILGDLANKAQIDMVFQQTPIDAVMHFAAHTDVGESVQHPLKYFNNNVTNSLNLLDSMIRYDVKTIVFSSSAAIFGIPEQKKIDEDHPTMPISPYGESKLNVEKMLARCDAAYGVKSCSLRYFNAAGGDVDEEIRSYKEKENNLIPLLVRSVRKPQEVLTIFGTDYPTPDGTCIRDYIHIEDLATAHLLALEQLFQTGTSREYNLGNGNGFSVHEVVAAAKKALKREIPIVEGERRPGDPPILVADARKAQRELHWTPRYCDLEQMIANAWTAMGA